MARKRKEEKKDELTYSNLTYVKNEKGNYYTIKLNRDFREGAVVCIRDKKRTEMLGFNPPIYHKFVLHKGVFMSVICYDEDNIEPFGNKAIELSHLALQSDGYKESKNQLKNHD